MTSDKLLISISEQLESLTNGEIPERFRNTMQQDQITLLVNRLIDIERGRMRNDSSATRNTSRDHTSSLTVYSRFSTTAMETQSGTEPRRYDKPRLSRRAGDAATKHGMLYRTAPENEH